MSVVDDIRDWLEVVIERGAERIDLRVRNDDARVTDWPILPKASNDSGREPSAPAKMASEIARAAEMDGRAQSGDKVFYGVYAYARDDRQIHRLFFEVGGRGGKASGRDDEVPPTFVGLVQQTQKQNAELHRLLIMSQEGRAEASDRMIAKLSERLDQMESKRVMVIETWERLATMQIDRETHKHQMVLEESRQKFLVEKLDMLVPVFLNRLLGGGPGKGSPFFGEDMVKQLLGKMSTDQVDQIMKGAAVEWKPDQIMLFAELYLAYQQKHAKDAAAASSEAGKTTIEVNGVVVDGETKGKAS
jgi:hypothetical protein